jgi:hypothetical protein
VGSLVWSDRSECEIGTAGPEQDTDDDTKKAPMRSVSLAAHGVVSFMVLVRGSWFVVLLSLIFLMIFVEEKN